MMKTLNKMKDKLQREGVELRSAREQVLDLSSRINDIAVSNAASFMLQTCSVMFSPDKQRRRLFLYVSCYRQSYFLFPVPMSLIGE